MVPVDEEGLREQGSREQGFLRSKNDFPLFFKPLKR
jgi:hypothetical protein